MREGARSDPVMTRVAREHHSSVSPDTDNLRDHLPVDPCPVTSLKYLRLYWDLNCDFHVRDRAVKVGTTEVVL